MRVCVLGLSQDYGQGLLDTCFTPIVCFRNAACRPSQLYSSEPGWMLLFTS